MFPSAAEEGRAIAAGRLDPVSRTEQRLELIRSHPAGDRIFAHVCAERARSEAIAAHDRVKAGLGRGPLDGVALAWKDNIDAANMPCQAGSQLLAHCLPGADAPILARATAQGAVCLGKTHMTELAFSGLGLNPMTATPPNGVVAELAPGGSSSGSAVAVALGLAAAAVGSDTGGSIRLPAAWNDLVGFKPAHGRLPMQGVVPLCPRFDVVGPIARTVQDCALVFGLLDARPAPDLRDSSLTGARLLVIEGAAFDQIRDLPQQGFEGAVDRLAGAGAQISRATLPQVAEALELSPLLFAPEAYGIWGATIEAAPDRIWPPIRDRFRGGAGVLAADHVAAWMRLHDLRTAFAAATAGYDAVIWPTSPILPPDAARLLADADFFAAENLLALRNTRIGNMLDLAAITLPTGVPMTGIMLAAQPGDEARLLRLAAAAEAALLA
ncbi:amidase [Paracoccus sp. p3-h83]|uniref:amidase n=1 Tax=Paracoccus sp. p3-h83 TaxID=3342805 RepID=UPI0035B9CC44